jgi:hypothetical protein
VLLLGQRIAGDTEALAAYSPAHAALPKARELRASERRLLNFLNRHEEIPSATALVPPQRLTAAKRQARREAVPG